MAVPQNILIIQTPYGTVDLAGFEVPPEAVARSEERATELVTLLDGRSLPRSAARSTLIRLKISSPQGHAVPGDRAAILQQLRIGDSCTITENLSTRTQTTIWTNILNWAAPVLIRQATDVRTGMEYFTLTLEFIFSEIT